MAAPTNLDADALRAFVAGTDLGSYARAAARLGRSPSAISLQLRKLEAQVGRPLLVKRGRGLALTEAGEVLLGHARRILELNDAAVAALRDASLSGEVRIGLPQDVAETRFPEALARFGRLYPNVRIQARVDRQAALQTAFAAGDLDLALLWEGEGREPVLKGVPMAWIGPRAGGRPGPARPLDPPHVTSHGRPLPLALLDAPCLFRREALAALDRAGIAWRATFSTPSLSGLWAAVAAGLGLTARLAYGLPPALAPLDGAGLPALPALSLSLLRAAPRDDGAAARLAALLRETIARDDA